MRRFMAGVGTSSSGLHDVEGDGQSENAPLVAASSNDTNQVVVPKRATGGILLAAFSGIAGFLFGVDTGNISGALPYITTDLLAGLHWTQGLIVSSAVLGAAVGSAGGGFLSDRWGRKAALKLADAFFVAGAVVMALAPHVAVLILGRLLIGLGIGLASVTAPVYIAETSPGGVRASLVAVNTLMITAGQFVAYFLDYVFTFAPGTWRWMLGIAAVPALVQVAGLSFLPESPRWLLAQGRNEEAGRAIASLGSSAGLQEEFREAQAAAVALKRQVGVAEALKRPEVRQELHLGVGLQILQQLSGINSIMYYTSSIIMMAGVDDSRTALLISMGPAAVNAAGTVVGMFCIESYGRSPEVAMFFRKLLLASILGSVVALLLLGFSFKAQASHSPSVTTSTCPGPPVPTTCGECIAQGCAFCSGLDAPGAPGSCAAAGVTCGPLAKRLENGCPGPYLPLIIGGVVLYLAAFSPGLGTVPWSVNAEIFPVEVRGLANGASATANWVSNWVVSQLFLSLGDYLGTSSVFWLLGAVAACGGIWANAFLPETKGLTLAEIQALFVRRAGGLALRSQPEQSALQGVDVSP